MSYLNEITVDNFAGGGGASTGIALGLGREIDIAILSKRGIIPMHQLKIGEEVWTHNSRWRKVTSIEKSDVLAVKVEGYGCTIFKAISGFEFYVREYAPKITRSGKFGRHEARLLEPIFVDLTKLCDKNTDSVYTSKYSGFAWASPIIFPRYWLRPPHALGVDATSDAFFYMIGRWLGDGWILKRKARQNNVRICAFIPEAAELERRLEATGLIWNRRNHSQSVDIFDLCAASSKILIPWLLRHFGQYAQHKTLPAWIFGTSKSQRAALIAGLVDADGHEREGGLISVVSVSRCLAIGLRLLLASVDIPASVSSQAAYTTKNIVDPSKVMSCREAFSVSWRRHNEFEKSIRFESHMFGRVRGVTVLPEQIVGLTIAVADDNSFIADGQIVRCGVTTLHELPSNTQIRKHQEFSRICPPVAEALVRSNMKG